jgi:putative membrane protein
MSARPLLWVHSLIKAALLFGFSAYITTLVKSDAILFYIAPRMVIYVKLAALGLYVVGAYQLYETLRQLRGNAPACDCEDEGHDHTPSRSLFKNTVFYGLFAFPLLIGFLMPDTSMGSALASKKGMNLSSSGSVKAHEGARATRSNLGTADVGAETPPASSGTTRPEQPNPAVQTEAQLKQLFPSDPYTVHFAKHAMNLYKEDVIQVPDNLYIETLTTLDLYADSFKGKTIELTGFVYRDEDMSEKQFVIGRFAVQCCSADASPYGLLVQYDKANLYPTDQWIKLTGTIGTTVYNGVDLMIITARKIQKIDTPKELYVSPNYDFSK